MDSVVTVQIEKLKPQFDILQRRFGDPKLHAIYGAGCVRQPDFCFVFMNPTGKNISAHAEWRGLRAPWLGTKNVWKLFARVGLLSKTTQMRTEKMRAEDWDYTFAKKVYQELKDKKVYVTNLSKSTQQDARHLPDALFRSYLPLLQKEIAIVKPKTIIALGNQVSSLVMGRRVKVLEERKIEFPLVIANRTFTAYAVPYPIGQGMRNLDKAVEDIRWIMKKNHET